MSRAASSLAAAALTRIHSGWNNLGWSTGSSYRFRLHSRAIAYLVLNAVLALLFLYEQAHPSSTVQTRFLAVDVTIAALSILIAWICYAYYRSFDTGSLLFVSMGFLGSGLINYLHIFQILELDLKLLPEDFFDIRNWSFSAGRFYLAVMLLFGWRIARGQIAPFASYAMSPARVILSSAIFLALVTLAALYFSTLPALSYELIASRLVKSSIGLLFLCVLYIVLRQGDWRTYPFPHWFILSLILAVWGQMVFIPMLGHAGDSIHMTGSLLWLGSCACMVVALLSSTSNFFRQASLVQLEERINQLIEQQTGTTARVANDTSAWHRSNGSGTFELNLVSGALKTNQVSLELLAGVEGVKTIRNVREVLPFLHPDDQDGFRAALHEALSKGTALKQEFRTLVAGQYRWFEAIGGVEFVNEKPARLLGFLNDVSERKALELEKAGLYRELKELVEALDTCATTARLSLDGTIEAANELFCRFCGVAKEDLLGQQIQVLLTPDPEGGSATEIWKSIMAGNTWTGHVLRHAGEESEQIVSATIRTRLDEHGEIDGIVFLGVDATERVITHRALNASIEAHRKSNHDLQMFAHVVSHDLQEPLRMVSSFLTLLERRYAGDLNTEAREFIQYAVDGALRMRDLLDGQLEFSRVQSKPLVFQTVDLNVVVRKALSNLAVLIDERGAAIDVGELPKISGDDAQLMQLFQNLVSNGIKFCPQGTPRVEIRACVEAGRHLIHVIDNGIGIDPSHYAKIFQMFQRLHSREEFPGTGVGLAVCQRIMERHGGSIEVESLVGQGSTFTLRF